VIENLEKIYIFLLEETRPKHLCSPTGGSSTSCRRCPLQTLPVGTHAVAWDAAARVPVDRDGGRQQLTSRAVTAGPLVKGGSSTGSFSVGLRLLSRVYI